MKVLLLLIAVIRILLETFLMGISVTVMAVSVPIKSLLETFPIVRGLIVLFVASGLYYTYEYIKFITKSNVKTEIYSLFKLEIELDEKDNKKIPRRGEEHFSISYEIFKGKGDNKRRSYLEYLVRKYENKGGFLSNLMKPISMYAVTISILMSTCTPLLRANEIYLKEPKINEVTFYISLSILVLGVGYFLMAVFTGLKDISPKEKDRRFYIDEVIPKVLDDMNKEKQKEIHEQECKQRKVLFQELVDAISQNHK